MVFGYWMNLNFGFGFGFDWSFDDYLNYFGCLCSYHDSHDFRGYPGNHDLHGSLLDLHDSHAQMQLLQAEGKALPVESRPNPAVKLQLTQH